MASNRIPIPVYNPDKTYDIFKSELELWEAVSELAKEKRGAAVALSLPDDGQCNLRSTVLQKITHTKLTSETGLSELKTVLNELLGKDDLEDCLTKYEHFEDYSRTTETVSDYICTFETKYLKMKGKGITLPPSILAFKLLRNAGISGDDKKLCLTGMDYSKSDELFEQAKKALKKYCSEDRISGACSTSVTESIHGIKQEVLAVRGRGGFSGQRERSFWPHQRSPGYNAQSRNWRGASARGRSTGNRPMNPKGMDGKPLLCKGCGSYRHFLDACPESWENMKKSANKVRYVSEQDFDDHMEEQFPTDEPDGEGDCYPNYVWMAETDQIELTKFSVEAQNCAVLDTACGSTVCGTEWFEAFVDTIGEGQVKLVQPEGCNSFKFGTGPTVPTLGTYEIPITIAGIDLKLKTDVVDGDIPLLLSKAAMKEAGVVIDMNTDCAVIFGRSVPLDTTSSGHYCVPIHSGYTVAKVTDVLAVSSSPALEQRKTFMKLHRQFGHPPQNKLMTLLKDAGAWKEEYKQNMNIVYDKCQQSGACRFKAKVTRPVVAMSLASDFNEKIAMDLKKWNGRWILHIVDLWSRFTISTFISRKRPSDVIHALLTDWCSIFGMPSGILTDNGGEFVGEEMLEVESLLNIEVLSTAAESPFQNGVCERNHQVVDSILTKLAKDFPTTPLEVLLKWACMAKNSLQMYEGFSSHQLVLGKNPNLPNVMSSSPSSLETTSTSEKFTKHINSLHAARKAFIQSEACVKIKKALKSKIRVNEQVFNPGDKVYYKRDSQDRWLGPAKVIFQDGKVVFLRHGAVWVKVSPNRLVKSGKEFNSTSCKINSPRVDIDDLASDDDCGATNPGDEDQHHAQGENDNVANTPADEDHHSDDADREAGHNDTDGTSEDAENMDDNNASSVDHVNKMTENDDSVDVPRRSQRVLNKQYDWEVYCTTPAIPIYEWQVFINEVPKELHNTPECLDAKQDELKKLSSFDVYEEIEDMGQECIGTRWVMTYKANGVKARLVAKGFQESHPIPSDSPTVARTAFRTLLGLASGNAWSVATTDIKSAFLQGQSLDREVYLKPPKEADTPPGVIWKLKKCLYGLNDGARNFYLSVREKVTDLGCFVSTVDPSLFYYHNKDGSLAGVLITHVDDFLHAGNQVFNEEVILPLKRHFVAGSQAEGHFRYVGFDVSQDEYGIQLSMDHYVDSIEFPRTHPGDRERQLTDAEKTQYRSIVGRLNWVVQGTRPDKAFDVIELSSRFKTACLKDLNQAKKTYLKLKEQHALVMYPPLAPWNDVRLVVYSDASHANLPDGMSSTYGLVVFLADSSGHLCPLSWRAGKIRRVVKSSLAAETLALQEGVEEAIYIQKLLTEMCPSCSFPIHAFVDNKSLVEALGSTRLVDDRRLRITIGALKETLQSEVRSVSLIPGNEQLANVMTKRGASGATLLVVFQTGKMVF